MGVWPSLVLFDPQQADKGALRVTSWGHLSTHSKAQTLLLLFSKLTCDRCLGGEGKAWAGWSTGLRSWNCCLMAGITWGGLSVVELQLY
jgi:hypothetical protein